MILVTGGTGFVGSALARSLASANTPVRVVSLRDGATPHIAGVEYVAADLCGVEHGNPLFESVDTIVHLASTTIPSISMTDPAFDARSNIEIALRLLEAARTRRIGNFVFASSGGTVYGDPVSVPVRESDPTEPRSPYGIVKLAIEKYVGLYSRIHGLRGISLRISNPYGYGQFFGAPIGVIARLLHHAFENTTFAVWGDGSVVRDYFHIDDLLRAFHVTIANRDVPAGVYNVGAGQGTSLRELIALVERTTSRRIKVRYEPARDVDVHAIWLDTGKFRNATGWNPGIELEDGVRRLWEELRDKPPVKPAF
jgi:UDP-glucose 4-epimerase